MEIAGRWVSSALQCRRSLPPPQTPPLAPAASPLPPLQAARTPSAAMAPTSARALHYVVKVADRTATVHFLREALGMHTLRHEEFSEGCEAACNGPYAGERGEGD